MQEINIQPVAEFHQCFKCNYEVITDQKVCPKCGRKTFFTSRSIRKRGIITVLCGLFIAGLMTVIALFVGTMLLSQMNDPAASKRILDDQFTVLAFFGLFGLLIVLGLSFIFTGGWMIAFGKRNKILVWLMLVFVVVVIATAGFLTVFLP
jgi:hypothetical protein